MACARAVPSLLLHVNIFLVVYSGAALATAARLKWDPSTYVALRQVFPQEYRIAAALLPAAAVLLLVLAHAAVLALRTRRPTLRRVLLLTYASLMALLMCGEVALACWMRARFVIWSRSPDAAELQHALKLRQHLQPLLDHLGHWHSLPSKVKDLIQEAEEDAPCNLYVMVAAAALLALLQTMAVLLALLLSARSPRNVPSSPRSNRITTYRDRENAPLRAVYKNGRLVPV